MLKYEDIAIRKGQMYHHFGCTPSSQVAAQNTGQYGNTQRWDCVTEKICTSIPVVELPVAAALLQKVAPTVDTLHLLPLIWRQLY